MRILFIGSVLFSYHTLKKLLELNAEIVGVCTKQASSFNSDFYDLAPLSIDNNIPYRYVDDINDKESLTWIKQQKPDIIFCFGWSSLLKNELLSLAPMGVLGYHPTKLPQNRGRHPLIWSLVLGLQSSASTFFFMQEGADDGDILSQKEFLIDEEDDASSLYDKVTKTALSQIELFIPQLQSNNYQRVPQDHTKANYWRKRGAKDGLIDFRMTSKAIYNLVRALTKPYVGAHIIYNEQEFKVWKVAIIPSSNINIEPGKVLSHQDNTFTVKTYDGAIKILEHTLLELPPIGAYL